jgi:hypothetical protein
MCVVNVGLLRNFDAAAAAADAAAAVRLSLLPVSALSGGWLC